MHNKRIGELFKDGWMEYRWIIERKDECKLINGRMNEWIGERMKGKVA